MAIITKLDREFTGPNAGKLERIVTSVPTPGYDARFLATDLSLGNTTQWNSHIGGEHYSTNGNGAGIQARDVSGRREVHFAGTEGFLYRSAGGGTISKPQPLTVMALIKVAATPSTTANIFDASAAQVRVSAAGKLEMYRAGAGAVVVPTAIPLGAYFVATIIFNGANSLIGLNSDEVAANVDPSVLTTKFHLSTAGYTAPYSMREMLIYPRALTAQETAANRAALLNGAQ